jgi:hypothetical protein
MLYWDHLLQPSSYEVRWSVCECNRQCSGGPGPTQVLQQQRGGNKTGTAAAAEWCRHTSSWGCRTKGI